MLHNRSSFFLKDKKRSSRYATLFYKKILSDLLSYGVSWYDRGGEDVVVVAGGASGHEGVGAARPRVRPPPDAL